MHIELVYRGRYHVRQALDLETISAVIKKGGHRVTLTYDPDTFGITDNVLYLPGLAKRVSSLFNIADEIAKKKPDLVIFSVLPTTYRQLSTIAEKLKNRYGLPIVFIGLHPTLVPKRVMQDRWVDYAIQGEVDGVINMFLSALDNSGSVKQVGNLWYRDCGEVKFTHVEKLIDLDTLPLPDKELFGAFVNSYTSYAVFISRGCPYSCSYCEESCVKKLYGSEYFRRRSVESVIHELLAAKHRYNYKEVIFKDSYLLGNSSWLDRFIHLYSNKIATPFKCFCTISGFDEKIARLLKKGGCYCVEFGLQTWNEDLRKKVLNRTESNADALRVFSICDANKLWYDIDHMFNIPGECIADHRIGALSYTGLPYLNRIKIHYLAYLPKASIIEYAQQKKLVPKNISTEIENGSESDFYNQDNYYPGNKLIVEGFSVLYKILPIIPEFIVQFLIKKSRVLWLNLLPSPIIACVQYIMSRRSTDRRFFVYLHLYPRKVFFSLWRNFH